MNKERISSLPQQEYNSAGGLFLTIGEDNFIRLSRAIEKAGFTSCSVMPFRAFPEGEKDSSLRVVHLEEAWNPTSRENLLPAILAGTLGHIKRLAGDTSEPPILQDALFPSEKECRQSLVQLMATYPGAKLISHKILPHRLIETPSSSWLLEINPAVEKSLGELAAWSKEEKVSLVFDPSHLQGLQSSRSISAPGQPTRKKIETMSIFDYLAKRGLIEVVDLNSPAKSRFNSRVNLGLLQEGVLPELVSASQEYPDIEFLRLELPISAPDQLAALVGFDKPMRNYLAKMHQAITENFNK